MILIHDRLYDKFVNRAFSRDVTETMLVYLNNGTEAMLLYPTNPPGIELYYHAKNHALAKKIKSSNRLLTKL